MSITLMSAVWRMDLPPTEKIVLLALADAANDDGVTWMAIRSKRAGKLDFIKKTSLSERSVQNSMKKLSENGLIERVFHEGKGVVYTVTLGGVQEMHPAGRAPRGAGDAPKPSINTSPNGESNKTRGSKRVPADFLPSPDNFQVAIDEGLTPGETERALAKFRDHTFGQPRSDWSATLNNWFRETADRKPKNDRSDRSSASPKLDKLERIALAMAASVERSEGEHSGDSREPPDEGGSVVYLQPSRGLG